MPNTSTLSKDLLTSRFWTFRVVCGCGGFISQEGSGWWRGDSAGERQTGLVWVLLATSIPAGECVDVIVLSDARPIYLPIHILIPVKEDLTAEQTETCQWKRIA